MKTWTWDEIFLARAMGVEPRTNDQWRTAYLKYGGSARLLYSSEGYVETQISMAIDNCTDIKTLYLILGFRNETSYALIQMNPRIDKDMNVNRDIMSCQIASGYILEKLLERKNRELVNTFERTFHMLFSNDATRGASCILFEGAGHRHLLASCLDLLHIRPLWTQSEPMELDLRHVQKTRNFACHDIHPFSEHDPKYYYRPLIGNLTGIDAFALEVDHDQHPISVVFFQFTTSADHPIETTFFEKLWVKRQSAKNMVKWKIIFVVPQDIEAEFVAQPLEPPSTEEKWGARVEQYVLGVKMEEVLGYIASRSFKFY